MTKKKQTKKTEPVVIPAEQVKTMEAKEENKHIEVIGKVIENKQIAPQDVFSKLTRGQIELIKRTIAKDASDDELKMFIQVCAGARLNPFLRQAHLIPFWDSKAGCERRAIVIGIDGQRAIAEDTGAYAGSDDAVFEGEALLKIPRYEGKGDARKIVGHEEHNVPDKATVTVHKMVEGTRCPFTASVWWHEVYPGEKKGGQWHVRPRAMISKCAEALALRKAFPKLLSNMYVPEEMDRAMTEGDEERRVQQGFQTLMKSVANASAKQLLEFSEKIKVSEKYTPEQKQQFLEAADKRMKELPDGQPVNDASK